MTKFICQSSKYFTEGLYESLFSSIGVPIASVRTSISKVRLKVIKLEYILRLKIKRNDWLIADTCPQSANHCTLFLV